MCTNYLGIYLVLVICYEYKIDRIQKKGKHQNGITEIFREGNAISLGYTLRVNRWLHTLVFQESFCMLKITVNYKTDSPTEEPYP